MIETEKQTEYIKSLQQYLSKKGKKELDEVLAYWKEKKTEWERLKKEFWNKYWREEFKKLLEYKWKYEKKIFEEVWENKHFLDKIVEMFRNKLKPWREDYKYFGKMTELEKRRYIEEYLYDYILYSGKIDDKEIESVKTYNYDDWRKWNVVMEKWVKFDFNSEKLWDEWVKAIAQKIELVEWVQLYLRNNGIKVEWARAISQMELKEWVSLDLSSNEIWNEWAKAIAQNMKLKEWVSLDLSWNQIWFKWADAIIQNLKLKKWVELDLSCNRFWYFWVESISEIKLEEWVKLDLSRDWLLEQWAEAISHMELKEWVTLRLYGNLIWDRWVEYILNNMKLKEGVILNLEMNGISLDMRQKLKAWEKSYRDRWINCSVII